MMTHGDALIDALARIGDGLPANALPFAVNEVTQVGLETIAAAFAYGASAVRFLLRARPRHDLRACTRTIALADPILQQPRFRGRPRRNHRDGRSRRAGRHAARASVAAIRAAPCRLRSRSAESAACCASRCASCTAPHPAPVDVVLLPERAPFGAVEINVAGCTLCLSCVSACPTGALTDDPERPMLRFAEDACVQCGLCQATCPEKVITLKPQLDFRAATARRALLKEEEPFCCIRCGKPFGVKSTIERVAAKLEGTHWMYKGRPSGSTSSRCATTAAWLSCPSRTSIPTARHRARRSRTTEDYLREREEAKAKMKDES